MSLPPVIYRDIGEEVPASDRIIYAAFIRHLDAGRPTLRAAIDAGKDTGVKPQRVWAIVKHHRPDLFDAWVLDSDPSVV